MRKAATERARWLEDDAGLQPEARFGDLAGARADGEMQRGLAGDDERFDAEPCMGIAFEEEEALGAEHLRGHQGDAVLRGLNALAHRVGRE